MEKIAEIPRRTARPVRKCKYDRGFRSLFIDLEEMATDGLLCISYFRRVDCTDRMRHEKILCKHNCVSQLQTVNGDFVTARDP